MLLKESNGFQAIQLRSGDIVVIRKAVIILWYRIATDVTDYTGIDFVSSEYFLEATMLLNQAKEKAL